MKRILALIILCGILCGGCSWFEDKRVVVKPEPVDNQAKWIVIAHHVKRHFKTDMTVREISENLAAEAAYQEYLQNKE